MKFALLAAGEGRLGFKGIKSNCTVHEAAPRFDSFFKWPTSTGSDRGCWIWEVIVSVPFDNREEGFREVRLHDPEGNSLTMFAWLDTSIQGRTIFPGAPMICVRGPFGSTNKPSARTGLCCRVRPYR